MSKKPGQLYLFGGDEPWHRSDWTSSDDRVRGGSSVSHLTCLPLSPVAEFHGNLDIKTLGGAGFASQRTTGEDRQWDLSSYGGLELDIKKSDGKRYTFILKDSLLPKSPNGREQSTVSWEYDFQLDEADKGQKIFVSWNDFKPTYRGRGKDDAEPLDLKNIKRFSLMMRSMKNWRYKLPAPMNLSTVCSETLEEKVSSFGFFGSQEGDFSLSIASMSAIANSGTPEARTTEQYRDDPASPDEKYVSLNLSKKHNHPMHRRQGLFAWLCGFL